MAQLAKSGVVEDRSGCITGISYIDNKGEVAEMPGWIEAGAQNPLLR